MGSEGVVRVVQRFPSKFVQSGVDRDMNLVQIVVEAPVTMGGLATTYPTQSVCDCDSCPLFLGPLFLPLYVHIHIYEGMCQLFLKVETMTVFTQIECTNDQIIQDFVYI